MAITGAGLYRRKPARSSIGNFLAGRDRSSASYQGAIPTPGAMIWQIPLWEMSGQLTNVTAGYLHEGDFQGSPAWDVGELGPCVRFDGDSGDFIKAFNTENSLRIEKPLPLSFEVIVEKFADTAAVLQSIIVKNDGGEYAGMCCGLNSGGVMSCTIGDNTGSTVNDRRTTVGTTALGNNQIYHLIWSMDTTTTGRFYINGQPETLGAGSGAGGAMAYRQTAPFSVGGGTFPNTSGFNGRIFLVNYFNRPIYDAEARMRAADPWFAFRDRDFRY